MQHSRCRSDAAFDNRSVHRHRVRTRISEIVVRVGLAAVFLGLLPTSAFAWWNTAWGLRRKITFNNSGQPSNLVDFPVLVRLDGTRVEYFRTQNAGEDIRFVDADDSTQLDHEIETWNEAGSSYVWVRVPQIDASSSADYIWMYYDNPAAADGQNAAGVWDASHRGVWHLKENPAGAPPQMQDSTSNGNDGTIEFAPVDFSVANHGSVMILHALTDAARTWVDEHLPRDATTWGHSGTVVEPRYIVDIVEGIRADGLEVRT